MFDKNAIRDAFSRAAPHYDAQARLQAQVRSHAIALAQPLWPAGVHILDAGCGTGALARQAPPWQIIGLDVSFGMCAVARQVCPHPNPLPEGEEIFMAVNATAEAIPFADAAFTGVFSSLMLQWANDPAAVWREIARVLRPGGQAVIATLTHNTLNELRASFAALDNAPHVSAFPTEAELLAQAQRAGLRHVHHEAETITDYHADALALMREIKAIGAANKLAQRRRGLMTRRQFMRLQSAYAGRFGQTQGLPATWNILYMAVEKAP